MGCSLLRQGMDKLIISLEGAEARAIDERAERERWSRDKITEVRKDQSFSTSVLNRSL
jgi:hypothetical protein